MPMLPGKSQATISKNIREFHGGPTYEHTKEKFGKGTADKQAVAASMHAAGKSKDPKGEDHKTAVAKMHPEHLHKLVQHAMSGKAGPEAQGMAQQAMQSPMSAPGGDQPQDSSAPPANRAAMFASGASDNDADDQQPTAPPSRASMFQRRSGGM